MSHLSEEQEWRFKEGLGDPRNWNILSGKRNGCPRGSCIAEGCVTWKDGKRIIRCDYFKAGDKVRYYYRWDQPREIETLVGEAVSAAEHGIGWFTEEGGFWWVYNMEKVEE